MSTHCYAAILAAILLGVAGCGNASDAPVSATIGPQPQLPAPDKSWLPTVNIAPAVGWRNGAHPTAGDGLQVARYATDLDHPRWLYRLPNGDILVAETNAPAKEDGQGGIRQWIMGKVQKKAGAAVPSANRITLLRDSDGDGVVDQRSVFLDNLNSPFGMVLVDQDLYVANTDALLRFRYEEGQASIEEEGVKVVDLPAGKINYHWTKNVVASADGSRLYVAVGSNSNIAEYGFDKEESRAAVWEIDRATGEHRIFASGLRNPVGMAWVPPSNTLWVAVNERDELGDNLVPDYMTPIASGDFYGWPYSYYGQHIDERVEQREPQRVEAANVPAYALGAHTASLGLAFSAGDQIMQPLGRGMFVGQHGSWNRGELSGYKVIFIPFQGDQPAANPVDILTGFVNDEGEAQGRPVGVLIDGDGALLVADDVGNTVWRVSAADAERANTDS